jgi:hypothetical protein
VGGILRDMPSIKINILIINQVQIGTKKKKSKAILGNRPWRTIGF